jgi:ureidoglycolate dehydrogenase (NAD+)
MLLIELLAGALTGAGVTQRPQVVPTGGLGLAGNATFLLAQDIAYFTDVDQFFADVDGLFERLDSVKPAPGFQRVIVPGEPEAEQRLRRTTEGTVSPVWSGNRSRASQPNRRSTWTTFGPEVDNHE